MRLQILLILTSFLLFGFNGRAGSEFVGTWQFIGYRYQGHFTPAPNPDLVLLFKFQADGIDDLFWSRKNEVGSCERKAYYQINNGFLQEQTFWVNPNNLPECGQDPDMQMGKKSETPARVIDGKTLEIDLHIDDEPLTYLWTKQTASN